MEFHHIPVMLNEVLEYLEPAEGGVYADGTLGGGGHSLEIAKRIGNGTLYGKDLLPLAGQGY